MTKTPQGGPGSAESDEPVANLRVPREFKAAFGEALTHVERSVVGDDPSSRSLLALRDMSTSFKAHAEVLDSILETQRRLLGAIGRADRSEMMVQSTQALNETFKSLQSTQRQLCERLEATGSGASRPSAGSLVGAGLLFALASAGLVASALLWGGGGRGAADTERLALLEDRVAAAADLGSAAVSLRDLADSVGAGSRETAAILERTAAISGDLVAERERLAEVLARAKDLEREIEALSSSLVAANTTSDGFRAKYLEAEEKSRRLEFEREEVARRLPPDAATPPSPEEGASAPAESPVSSAAAGAVAATPGPEAGDSPPAATAEAASAGGETPAGAERIAAWRDAVNRLLAVRSVADRYEVESIRGVVGGAARGVRLRKLSGGETVKAYEAESLRAYLDEENRWVEFRMEEGRLQYDGRSIPFLNGRFSFMVMEVDGADWKRADLPFLDLGPARTAIAPPPVDAGPPPVGSRRQ